MANRLLAYKVSLFGVGFAVLPGAYTRLVDAGPGCPDWSGCDGFIGVPDTPDETNRAEQAYAHALLEADKAGPGMIHRYFAGPLGLVIALLAARASQDRTQPPGLPPLLLLLLVLAVQVSLGTSNVVFSLPLAVAVAHNGVAALLLLSLVALIHTLGRHKA